MYIDLQEDISEAVEEYFTMNIQELFMLALIPVLKTLLIAIVGLFLALDRVSILTAEGRHHLNNVSWDDTV